MQQKILIVDDDPDIVDLIEICLVNEDYEVITAADGLEALGKIDHSIHLVILDVMMPRMDGIKACIEIRKKYKVPIIFLTAKVQDTDQILGLQIGADDYIKKPFSPPVLVAKVRAMLRRNQLLSSTNHMNQELIQIKELTIDAKAFKVLVSQEEVQLTKTEFEILLLLAKHKGQVFSIKHIYESIWQEDYFDDSANTVMVHIKRLRKKLDCHTNSQEIIQTVWGVGYKIG
ncbi:MAG: response regulator transcription factor [Mobilitalea sp.]